MRLRTDDVVKSVQSLNVFHKSKDIIAGANASGKVYLWEKHSDGQDNATWGENQTVHLSNT